jgi:hypothetical protein
MLPNENIGSCIHFYLLTLLVGHSEQFPNFYLKRRDLSRRYKECLFKLTLSCSWNDIVLSVRFELRFFRYHKILNCYVVNTSALGYLPPNESEELLNISPYKGITPQHSPQHICQINDIQPTCPSRLPLRIIPA